MVLVQKYYFCAFYIVDILMFFGVVLFWSSLQGGMAMKIVITALASIVFALVFTMGVWKIALGVTPVLKSADTADSNFSINTLLDTYQKGAKLSSHFQCEGDTVSIKNYSALDYTLLEMSDGKISLYLLTNEYGESVYGGKQYFKRLKNTIDAEKADEKEWLESLIRMSPNFQKYIAKTQRKPSDTTPQEQYQNDCHNIDVGIIDGGMLRGEKQE